MEADAKYTFVGAGVLVLAAALIAAVVWLRNVGAEGEFRRYAIHFEHQAVDGLEIGADVTLRGLRVGRVEDYTGRRCTRTPWPSSRATSSPASRRSR